MPVVVIYMAEGRTLDQKRALARNVTNAVVESVGVKPEQVTIRLIEQSLENFGHGGVLRVDQQ